MLVITGYVLALAEYSQMSTNIVIHYTCNSDTHSILVYMNYRYTFNTDTHAIVIHMKQRYTHNKDTHEAQIHVQY